MCIRDRLEALQQIIEDRRIDFIFPAHDSAVTRFSGWEQQGRLGLARVVSSPFETTSLVRSKRQTYLRFEGVVPTPQVYQKAGDVQDFPVFLKPDVGQGSRGTCMAMDPAELECHLRKDPSLLILEYLPGREYTVDCLTDRHGVLRFSEGRHRNRISNGISVNSTKARDARFATLAARINGTIRLSGPWFFQVKERADGELVLMEIATRIAGASCFHRAMGVNLPLLSLYDRLGHELTMQENAVTLEMDRQLHNRYRFDHEFRSVYVDLDDTLIADGKVNHRVLGLLYRFKSQGKSLHLITRHLAVHGNEAETLLRSTFIDPRLFDQIIYVPLSANKSSRVPTANAIFVDDSFRGRHDVAARAGLPVFDVNQFIEVFD